MSGRIQFQFELGGQSASKDSGNTGKRILILAELGAGKSAGEFADRKIRPIDVDNFDEVLAGASPQLRISLNGNAEAEVRIDIRKVDDFHPDELFRQLPIFETLRRLRRRVENPATFAAAVEELLQGMGTTSTQTSTSPTPAAPEEAQSPRGSLFDQLLGKEIAEHGQSAGIQTEDAVHRLIRQIVEPNLAKGVDPGEQRQWLSVVDDAIAQLMRRILHHPAFQKLESTWRGIHWLIARIEDSEALKLFLLDASEAELAADLAAADGQVERTAIYRLMTNSSIGVPGGEPWSLVIGNYTFGATVESLDLLELLGAVSAGCGGVFIGAASPALLGCTSLAETPDAADWSAPSAELAQRWQDLRHSPPAPHIGMALPRFMLRLPYGKKSDPIDSFQFEEMPSHPPHKSYLWGNPAFACGALIANTWIQDANPVGTLREIDDLPYHILDDGGEQSMKPCAEVYLNEKTANTILGQGIMPLLSVRQSNRVLVPRLQTILQPPFELP